jgi:hypothetical protein
VAIKAACSARVFSISRRCAQGGELLVLLDRELLARGIEVLGAHQDFRVLLHVVALLAAGFGLLGEARQALGVEGVVGVEELLVGLVEAGQ